ncbi:MAG: hypothetical protein CMJ18_23105 [Phycisphaeraceae bacterium]|nr:hypothetical protein [Phycisphaeraceae bacterium]
MIHRFPAIVTLAALGAVMTTPFARADDGLRPAWQCLPEETVFAATMPNGRAFANAMRARTALGAIMFDGQRIEKAKRLLAEQSPEEWNEFETGLARYGLKPDDFVTMLQGETGMAILLDHEDQPLAIVLAWVEPGEELAQRMWNAAGQLAEDHKDGPEATRRVDIDIAGHRCMHLTTTRISVVGELMLPDGFGDMDLEAQRAAIEQAQAGGGGAAQKLETTQLLMTRIGGRLIAAMIEPDEPQDEEVLTQVLSSHFGRFLKAHDGGGGGFAERLNATPGVQDALPQDGVPAFEIGANLKPLIRLADSEPEAARVVAFLGLDRLGMFAMRSVLDGNAFRQGMLLSAPAPRSDLLSLMDQAPIESDPPAWVPTDLLGYSHISADLGKAYAKVKQMVIAEYGDAVTMQLEMAETQVHNMTGGDIASLLSSLGHRHMVLTFDPGMRAIRIDPDQEPMEWPDQRVAMVWEVRDQNLWAQLLNMIGMFAGGFGDKLQRVDEQGFSGWRMSMTEADGIAMDGGILLGGGYLVFAYGEGIVERTLAVLNRAPEGRAALRNSEIMDRARKLVNLQPGIMFQVMDGQRYARSLHQMMEAVMNGVERTEGMHDGDLNKLAIFRKWRALLPSQEELENVLGPAVGYARMNKHGLEITSANDMPPAP